MHKKITNSALWAAYGDAVGFITELSSSRILLKRIRNERVLKTVSWKRLVGGRFGAFVDLPAGSYSDDTQLRLATSRSIDGAGYFDVEAFAKIELPVWLSYSLGAGIGSKAAASNLTKANVAWFSNFFIEDKAKYLESGGNGAAMRIQPIVWRASQKPLFGSWLIDIVKNTICTHGHPRGVAGAIFHSLSLKWTLEKNELPGPQQWKIFCSFLSEVPDLIAGDGQISTFWLPTWRSKKGVDFATALKEVEHEIQQDIQTIEQCLDQQSGSELFRSMVYAIKADESQTKGSGTKTSLLATALAWTCRGAESPEAALLISANMLECDTDSIATMAGALLGCLSNEQPTNPLQDTYYITSEAKRIADIAIGGIAESFRYPDLLRWQPPKTQNDAVLTVDDRVEVEGLGGAKKIGERYDSKAGEAIWQWLRLDFGQTILAKQRTRPIAKNQILDAGREVETIDIATQRESQSSLFVRSQEKMQQPSIHQLTREAIRSGFDPRLIGDHVLQLSENENGIELTIGYVAILSKARLTRKQSLIRNIHDAQGRLHS